MQKETLRFISAETEGMYLRSGFYIHKSGMGTPSNGDYVRDDVPPNLFLTMNSVQLVTELEYDSESTEYFRDSSNAGEEYPDGSSLEHIRSKAISGVASTKRTDDGWSHDSFVVAGSQIYRGITTVELTIRPSKKDIPTVTLGAHAPDAELYRPRETRVLVFVVIDLPAPHFEEIWNDLSSKSLDRVSLETVFSADFRNLFFDVDPIGGQAREILIIDDVRCVENGHDIPEEFLNQYKIGPIDRLSLPLRITLSERSSLTSALSERDIDADTSSIEQEERWSPNVHELYEQNGTLASRHLTLVRKVDKISRHLNLVTLVAMVGAVLAYLRW